MADSSLSNSASSAYASITSSAQRVLPLASTLVSEATGFAALSESYSDASAQLDASSTDEDHAPSTDESTPALPAREDHQEELANGPSSTGRLSLPQTQIGTETGIPTTAGAGSTASPDDDVRGAIAKEAEKQGGGASQAAVGVDYSDQPCPTADARRDEPTSKPAEGKTQFESESSGASSNAKSDDTAATSTAATATAEEQEDESGKDKGASFKDKLKGQAKVVAGKITRNDEKVELGKMLKAGASRGGDA